MLTTHHPVSGRLADSATNTGPPGFTQGSGTANGICKRKPDQGVTVDKEAKKKQKKTQFCELGAFMKHPVGGASGPSMGGTAQVKSGTNKTMTQGSVLLRQALEHSSGTQSLRFVHHDKSSSHVVAVEKPLYSGPHGVGARQAPMASHPPSAKPETTKPCSTTINAPEFGLSESLWEYQTAELLSKALMSPPAPSSKNIVTKEKENAGSSQRPSHSQFKGRFSVSNTKTPATSNMRRVELVRKNIRRDGFNVDQGYIFSEEKEGSATLVYKCFCEGFIQAKPAEGSVVGPAPLQKQSSFDRWLAANPLSSPKVPGAAQGVISKCGGTLAIRAEDDNSRPHVRGQRVLVMLQHPV